jgi:hypothetical protein
MMRKATRGSSVKEPASRKASGLAHLMTALHQNAAAVVNSKTQLNGPDQVNVINVVYFHCFWGPICSHQNASLKVQKGPIA